MKAHDLGSTYVHLKNDDRATPIDVGPSFWPDLTSGKRKDLGSGRLAMSFTFSEDWDTWERHPAGEELVILVSGEATFVYETEGGGTERVTVSKPGQFVLVPKGAWHTAKTSVETTMIFVTAGAGTENRPAS